MLPGDYKFRFLFIGLFFLFSFSLVLNASVSLNDYPQIKSSWDEDELTIAINKLQEAAKIHIQNAPKDINPYHGVTDTSIKIKK